MRSLNLKEVKEKTAGMVTAKNITACLFFFTGLLLSCARVFDTYAPFGISITGGSPVSILPFSALGALIGYAITGNWQYVLLTALVTGVKFIFSRSEKQVLLTVSTVFLLVFFISFTKTPFAYYNAANFVLTLCESALAASGVYFFTMAKSIFRPFKVKPNHYTTQDIVGIGIIIIAVVMSLYRVQISLVNLGLIFGSFSCLWATGRYGLSGGLTVGCVSGFAIALASSGDLSALGVLCLAILFCSLFSKTGRFSRTVAFICAAATGAIMTGNSDFAVKMVVSVSIISCVYVFLPYEICNRKNISIMIEGRHEKNISNKLAFASLAVEELVDSIEKVSERLTKINQNDMSYVYTNAADQICKNCAKCLHCWEREYSQTMDVMNNLSSKLKQTGAVSADDFPDYFTCLHPAQLITAINGNFGDFKKSQTDNDGMENLRNLMNEQLLGISVLLSEFSEEIEQSAPAPANIYESVKNVLIELNIKTENFCVLFDRHDRIVIEIYTHKKVQDKKESLTHALSKSLERDFELPVFTQIGDQTKVAFFEKCLYSLDFYAVQKAANDGPYCGDSYEYFTDASGMAHLILSDGMGSGSGAAIDSSMTCSLVTKLIKAGFGFRSAVKFINSALIVKSTKESLATVDLTRFDMYTGETNLIKAGAAATYVRRGGKCTRLEVASLPLGILNEANFDSLTLRLNTGDMIVMVSDGAMAEDDHMSDDISAHSNLSAKELALHLCETAKNAQDKNNTDDITVIVASIRKNA